MTKHTPGPWEVFKSGTFWGVDAGRKSIIVWGDADEEMGVQGTTVEQAHANALLIAAAPEMLEALKGFVKSWSEGTFLLQGAEHMKACRDAIEKAEASVE